MSTLSTLDLLDPAFDLTGDDMRVAAGLLACAARFDVLPYDPRRRLRSVAVERRTSRPAQAGDAPSFVWTITSESGSVLARDGYWEQEPQPSSRDDDFLARTRWDDPIPAILFLRQHLKAWPDGYKPVDPLPGDPSLATDRATVA